MGAELCDTALDSLYGYQLSETRNSRYNSYAGTAECVVYTACSNLYVRLCPAGVCNAALGLLALWK